MKFLYTKLLLQIIVLTDIWIFTVSQSGKKKKKKMFISRCKKFPYFLRF